MNTQQDHYAQMHAKLREGLQILSEASREETHKLNAALIKLHSALEDFVRIAVAQRAPQPSQVQRVGSSSSLEGRK